MKKLIALCALALFAAAPMAARAADAKIVLVAGNPSHGPGDHEFNAGIKLLAKCLGEIQSPRIDPVVVTGGWPQDEKVFDGARSIVFFMDGGGGHPMIQKDRLKTLQALMDQGVGVACLHYAVEVPKGVPGDRFLDWIGGYYETGFSTNPHWVAEIKNLPDHPITRGVKPFSIRDEWYFNIRFRPEMKGVTPIVVAKPDDQTRQGVSASPRGPYKHILEAKGRDEVLAWAVERPDGGRGFGFTGAHTHKNWGNADFRKLVLNAVLWTAKLDVPSTGVQCDVSEDDLEKNLDPKGQPRKK
ncbi:MAG: ThuA domain-containing protein [Isosphaeraceae bacterium]|nr:ThuA domain-containing protein [Isosphaeraceae bacterium]